MVADESFEECKLPVEELEKLAIQHVNRGRYDEAERIFKLVKSHYESALTPSTSHVARVTGNLGYVYKLQGRFAEAELLYKNALEMKHNTLGANHPDVAASLNNLGELYRAQNRFAEAESSFLRALTISDRMPGPEHNDVALILSNLSLLYSAQDRLAEAEELCRRALSIFEKRHGPEHPDVATVVTNLAEICRARGWYDEAEPLYRRGLQIREKLLGPEDLDVANSLDNLAGLYQDLGRYAECEALYERVLAIRENTLGCNHPDVATSLISLARLCRTLGRYGEAEPLYKRALEISETAHGSNHLDVAIGLNNLAVLYRAQGRYNEAALIYRRALAISKSLSGRHHTFTATIANNLAGLYWATKRYEEAEPLYVEALAVLESILGAEHPDVATTVNNLVGLYWATNRHAEAEALCRRVIFTLKKQLGRTHPDLAQALNNLAVLYKEQKRYGSAEALYKRALAISEKALGPDHPQVAISLNNLAALYDGQTKFAKALSSIRRATEIWRKRGVLTGRLRTTGILAEQTSLADRYRFHLRALSRAIDAGVIGTVEGAHEAFEVFQLASVSRTGRAIARMGARFASGEGALAMLARRRETALDRWEQLDGSLVEELSKPPEERRPERDNRLRVAIEQAEAEIDDIDSILADEFPAYTELTNPKPLSLDEATSLLGMDEALALFIEDEDTSYVYVVSKSGGNLVKLNPGRQVLKEKVSKLRWALDPARNPSLSRHVKVLLKGERDADGFDVTLAHQLYTEIWAPMEHFFAGVKHVFVVPDSVFESLPVHVLVTEPPAAEMAGSDRLRAVEWLAKREHGVSVLPSASSLRALRELAMKTKPGDSFIGFGDPVLGGRREPDAVAVTLDWRGTITDIEALRSLVSLPDSAAELEELAQYLSMPRKKIFLGAQATERQVKKLSASGDLAMAGVLAFATHGAMAGELKGFNEPGLVLTPPEQASAEDDGFLAASEVSHLHLNADWVLLSACNTAAADGTPGAEGLSGLARAFFYAGARSLLVSHWSVYSEAAVKLTTGTLGRVSQDPTIGRAEALRQTMVELIAHGPNPHPAYWAPFFTVGDTRSHTQ